MTENAVTVRITHAWAARRAAFESSCRSGSGPASDPDAIAAQIARDVEAAAREELRAIRDAYFRPPAAPAAPPGAASSITIERPAAATPHAPPDATVERTPSDPDDDAGFELFHQTPSKTGPAAKPLPPTPQVPGYAILGVLGHGGMGVVYRARHLALDREVALKMILKGPHASPESVARFLGEARAVARLNHPNIVQIYQIDENAGQPSFALEYCPAGSLDKALDKQPQPPAKAAADAETLCRAVQAAHDAGVVHRDLKPSNVLVAADGALKVTDFGLARMADGGDPTGTGSILGSPPYMAPEQAAGRQREVGPRSDQYSLGATLYEFLTGTPPFRGPTPIETIRQVIDREPVAPSALQPGVPKDLETICLKALAKDPAKRYASAAAMADDLKAFREGRPIAARPVGRGEKAWRWAKRNPRVAALLGAVAALLAVLAVAGAVFTAVYRTKAAEAEGHFREAEGRGMKLTAALDQSEAHFRQAEDRGVKLAAALDQSETNLKESNENYGFAREIAVVVSQKLPAVLQSRVADPAARRDIGDMVAQAMLARKGGGVRQLPDRVLFTVLLQKSDAALDRRDVATAHAVLIEATALAERMRATEPKELDKADGHYARVLEKRAYLHLRASQLVLPGTDVAAERASGRGYIQRAVELARERVKAPRSHELEPSERELNLAEFVALQARFEDDPKEAEAMQKEALGLAAVVWERKADQGAQRFLAGVQYQYSDWLSGQRRRADRKAALEKAVAGMTAYQTANPDDVGVRMTLGEWNRELGDLIYLDGDRAGPMPHYRAAYDLLRPLALNPQALTMEKDMAADAYRAGLDRLEAKKPEEAEAFFRSSFRLAEEAMDRGKVTYELLNLAALAAARCGEYRRAKHWTAKVESQTKHKLEQLIEAACCTATLAGCVDTSPDLAHLTPEKRAELKAETVADAVRLLAEWRDVLNLPANAAERDKNIASLVRRLSTEPDLDGIRGEKAFQAFVAETKGTPN